MQLQAETWQVAVSGATGLVGRALVAALTEAGHTVRPLVRRAARPGEIAWDPEAGTVDTAALAGVDVVFHLAGESIAGGRWTPERKRAIRESRERGTRVLAEALAGMERPPRVLVSASAIGFYGDRDDTEVDEASPMGHDFLAAVCAAWEAATAPAAAAGLRVVRVRIGVVLDATGGALGQMLLPFRLGLGGVLGSGRQWMSWVTLDDLVRILYFAALHPEARGALNATAPTPVTNAAFTRTLGRVLGRPAVLPVPALAVRLLFGELGDALLLHGARVLPGQLGRLGFRFQNPLLEDALRHVLAPSEDSHAAAPLLSLGSLVHRGP